jgi:hypothetical protein
MTIRFLIASVVVLFFAETILPAAALPVPFAGLAIPSTDTSDAFILVKKGKGHGDGDERFERHLRHHADGVYRHHQHSYGRRGSHGHQGFGNYRGSGGGNRNQPDGQN